MGFTEVLTIIFVLLKVFGVITWSWWIVFAPEIVALVLYVVFFIIGVCATHKTKRHFDNKFDNMFK